MRPLIPDIIENDPFRTYALLARQYWVSEYERLKDEIPHITLSEYLDLHWQNKDYNKESA